MTQETVEKVVIFFAGDSGDGIQLTGSQFTNTAALYGNDLSTFPDFPAEIRAPKAHWLECQVSKYLLEVLKYLRPVMNAMSWS